MTQFGLGYTRENGSKLTKDSWHGSGRKNKELEPKEMAHPQFIFLLIFSSGFKRTRENFSVQLIPEIDLIQSNKCLLFTKERLDSHISPTIRMRHV